jgi:hypothetical protein
MMTSLEQVQETLSQLTERYPETLSYADLDGDGKQRCADPFDSAAPVAR